MTEILRVELDNLFNKFPVLRSEGVPDREITESEVKLEITYPSEYRAFISIYGSAIVGSYPIFGLRRADALGDWSVEDMTLRYRNENWPGINGSVVVSMDGAGNPIYIGKDGSIYLSDHDSGSIELLARTFDDFLKDITQNI